MKMFPKCLKIGFLSFCLIVFILSNNSCILIDGIAVMAANGEIGRSVVSAENEDFQEKSGLNLVIIKRGLWSAQNTYWNKSIKKYYLNLLNNDLIFSLEQEQKEFALQVFQDDKTKIIINNQYQNYTGIEREILIITSTSCFALFSDDNYDQKNIPNMFFRIINGYSRNEIQGIIKSQWYKDKNVTVTKDGIIINES